MKMKEILEKYFLSEMRNYENLKKSLWELGFDIIEDPMDEWGISTIYLYLNNECVGYLSLVHIDNNEFLCTYYEYFLQD